jgi:hypothetical protein
MMQNGIKLHKEVIVFLLDLTLKQKKAVKIISGDNGRK